jgi:hypothetical protein
MERNELALEIAEALELPEVLSHALNTKSLILYYAKGRRQEGTVLMKHALDVALAHDRVDAAFRAYNNMTSYLLTEGRPREALEHASAFGALARRVGSDRDAVHALQWTANLLLSLGEWDESLSIVDDIQERVPSDTAKRWSMAASVPIFVYRGQLDEARHRLAIQEGVLDPSEVQSVQFYRENEALLRMAEGRPVEALAAAEAALQTAAAQGEAWVAGALDTALLAAFALDDDAKVDELLAIIEQAPPGRLTPFLRALGSRFDARRAARQGDDATAHAGFGAAAAILREIEWLFDLAVVLLEHAEWLAGEDRTADAEPLAAEARKIFERLRATPYVERVDRLPVGVTV